LLFYNRLSRKPLLFKSFIGLSVQEFDNIYDEIKSKYTKHEIKRLSYRKDRKRSIGGGRHFKLDVLLIRVSKNSISSLVFAIFADVCSNLQNSVKNI